MQKPFILLLAALTLANATLPSPRLKKGTLPLALRQSTTSNCATSGYTTCDDGCMPLDGVCCNDGSATYCDSGYRCETNGCCPVGETCSGSGGGTQTIIGIPTPTATSNYYHTSTNAAGDPQGLDGKSFFGGLALAVAYLFV